jgi:homoserine dehydrogenase
MGRLSGAGAASMGPLRIWLVGFGVVGRWVARALEAQSDLLGARYGRELIVTGIGNARDGFVYHPGGLDPAAVLAAAAAGRPITGQAGARVWESALEGLRATEADLLVEVTASPPPDGEPGLAHVGLRGVLNATANSILSQMSDGASYEQALAEAQRVGLAEPDPSADGEGEDTVAKVMILSAPLAHIDGATNALIFQASPVGEIMIVGPGAGPQLAGQGVLSDIIAVARGLPLPGQSGRYPAFLRRRAVAGDDAVVTDADLARRVRDCCRLTGDFVLRSGRTTDELRQA